MVVTFRPRAVPNTDVGLGLSPRQLAILKILSSGLPTALSAVRAALVEPPTNRAIQQDLEVLRERRLVEAAGRGRGATYRMVKE